MSRQRLVYFAILPFASLIVSFAFAHGDAFAAGGTLANGENVTGNVAVGQTDQWTFVAATGTAVTVSVGENTPVGQDTPFNPEIRVIAPDGTTMGTLTFGLLRGEVNFTAPLTGTYTALISHQDNCGCPGPYVLTLAEAPGAFIVPAGDEGGPMVNGGNYKGNIQRGDLDQWSFVANKGDAITVSVGEDTPVGHDTLFNPEIRVHGPDGTSMGGPLAFGILRAELSFTAPLTGTYTVLVSRQDDFDTAGPYMLTLAQAPGAFIVPAGDEGGPMVNGGTYTGTIKRGDLDQWSFGAVQGAQVSVGVTEVGPDTVFNPFIRVHGPDGTSMGSTFSGFSSVINFTAPLTGTYTVLISRQDDGDGIGLYSLSLAGAGAPPGTGPIVNLPGPIRIVDTRQLGRGPIAAGTSRCFEVAGVAGIPVDAGAVVLNVTAVGYGTDGWLTVYPNGQAVPATSTLNFDIHEYAMANGSIMRIGTGGQVCVNVGTVGGVAGSAQVVLDATGYLTADDLQLLPMLDSPQRVVDTRSSSGVIPSGSSRCFVVTNVMGIPSDAAAIVVNVTAVGHGVQGWLTAYPNGQSVPATSTVNFDTTEYAIANGSIVRVGTGGQVCVNTGTVGNVAGSSHVILDVTGYLTAAGLAQMPMLTSPQRVVDTRSSGGSVASGQSRCFNIAGLVGVPSTASAVVLNVTAVGYQRQGWLTVYPSGQLVPATSTLNFDTTEYAMANGTVMAVGSGGQVCVNVGTVGNAAGNSQIIIDVVGYI